MGSARKGGWKKERVSDGSYGNWRFITPRQAAQSCLPCWPLVETRGRRTPIGDSGRESALGALRRRKRLMKIKRRKKKERDVVFSPRCLPRDMTRRSFLQHRNYFVITRSLCGAKSPEDELGVELCVKRELYIRGDHIQRISLNNNKSSPRRKFTRFTGTR